METKNGISPVLPETALHVSKETYEAPVIEIIEVQVERGFQDSLGGGPPNRDRPSW